MKSDRNRAQIISIIGLVVGLGSCGDPDVQVAQQGQSSAAEASVRAEPLAPTQPARDLPIRVARAYVMRTTFPSTAIADYILTNRRHRKLVIECLADAGFAKYGYDTSDAPVLPSMVDSFRLPLQWVSPPQGMVPLPAIAPGIGFADPETQGWSPPAMSEDELLAFEAEIATCESRAPFAGAVDWRGAEAIDQEMQEIVRRALKDDRFAPIQQSYAKCIEEGGGTLSDGMSSDDFTIVGVSAQTGIVDQRVLELDAQCRSPLYDEFIMLEEDRWEDWLRKRGDDLERLVEEWAALEKESGIG
jgi:hypothetical protein